jgi:hypothetical protein
MKTLSANCVSIAIAIKNNTLSVVECFNERLQCSYWAISDDAGLIEVALSAKEADDRVRSVKLSLA